MPIDATGDSPVALVTGGARRVGRAVCLELASRGYRIAIHANSSLDSAQDLAQQIEQQGGQAASFGADLRDEGATREMIERCLRHFGQLDALINCAANWGPAPLEVVSADDLRRFFDVNAVGTFVCAQHAGLLMCGQDSGGVIINFGDAATARPSANYAAYHPSKGAVETITRCLAIELAQRNPKVRVNAVLPGPVLAAEDEPLQRKKYVLEGTLLATSGQAEHLAHAVVFLVENPLVTGLCLPIDGGRSLSSGW